MRTPLLLLALVALLPAPARACWDGVSASVGRVSFQLALSPEESAEWAPDEAQKLATWGRRLDALLPDGGSLTVQMYESSQAAEVELCGLPPDGRCESITWPSGRVKLRDLFNEVAMRVGAPPEGAARARSLSANTRTVEVLAALDRRSAERVADRINAGELELHGFYVAGGFPARNPSAHVVRATDHTGRPTYQVLVGAFLTRAEAERARAELRDAIGLDGRVRLLAAR
jgi:SPOR domain